MNQAILGRRIRELRRERGLTLEQVGNLTGLSKSLLSKVENAQVSPPIATLSKIGAALEVPIGFFFQEEPREDTTIYVPKAERVVMDSTEHGSEYRYEHLAANGSFPRLMEPFVVSMDANTQTSPRLYDHPGDEFLMVLVGEMEYLVGSTTYHLGEGDALYLDARVPHGPKQLDGKQVKYLVVFTNR